MSILQSGLGPLLLGTARPEELLIVMGILDECAAWLHSRGIAQWASPQPPHEWDRMQAQIALGHVTLVRLEADRSLIGTLRIEWEDAVWPDNILLGGYVHSLAVCNHARGTKSVRSSCGGRRSRSSPAAGLTSGWTAGDKNLPLRRYYEGLGFRHCGDFQRGVWSGALYEKEAALLGA